MENCIFCKIATGIIPSTVVYEDEYTVAFLDRAPKVTGHTLLIPKKHYRWFHEMDDDTSNRLFKAARTLAPLLLNEHHADIVKLSIVGTEVAHVHVHLLPHTLKNAPTL